MTALKITQATLRSHSTSFRSGHLTAIQRNRASEFKKQKFIKIEKSFNRMDKHIKNIGIIKIISLTIIYFDCAAESCYAQFSIIPFSRDP